MSNLRRPSLGPIVGDTTANSCHIMIRGGMSQDSGAHLASESRTLGVITVEKEQGKAPPNSRRQVHIFRLNREYDRTGVFRLGLDKCIKTKTGSDPLLAETEYVVRVGTLAIDDPMDPDNRADDDDLISILPDPKGLRQQLLELPREGTEARFTTFPEGEAASLSFLLGSCRYPGMFAKVKEADRIFKPALDEAMGRDGRAPARFVLMVGDQIYADKLNRHVPIGLADTFEEFQSRYLDAFGSRNMRQLLRQIPTYMILDDHEIEDNWSQDRIRKAQSRKVFNLAMGAYRSYQWSHGPRTYGDRLYYSMQCAGYSFFALDMRTQRFMEDTPNDLSDNRLLGRPSRGQGEPSQLERLVQWLRDSQNAFGNAPKFIVSPSVFAPNPMDARTGRLGKPSLNVDDSQMVKWMEASDSWPAFPETRRYILRAIIDSKIQNVVFLSGDIHCSNVAQISLADRGKAIEDADGEPLAMASITSSAFYWPFPFADGEPSDYVYDSTDQEQLDTFLISATETMDYEAWNFTQEDNFCRIDVDKDNARIEVRPYDKKGRQVCKTNWWGSYDEDEPLISQLRLAPW